MGGFAASKAMFTLAAELGIAPELPGEVPSDAGPTDNGRGLRHLCPVAARRRGARVA